MTLAKVTNKADSDSRDAIDDALILFSSQTLHSNVTQHDNFASLSSQTCLGTRRVMGFHIGERAIVLWADVKIPPLGSFFVGFKF